MMGKLSADLLELGCLAPELGESVREERDGRPDPFQACLRMRGLVDIAPEAF